MLKRIGRNCVNWWEETRSLVTHWPFNFHGGFIFKKMCHLCIKTFRFICKLREKITLESTGISQNYYHPKYPCENKLQKGFTILYDFPWTSACWKKQAFSSDSSRHVENEEFICPRSCYRIYSNVFKEKDIVRCGPIIIIILFL